MDNQRLFLYVALALVVFMIWTKWDEEQRPAPPPPSTVTVPGAPTVSAPDAPAAPGAAAPAPGTAPAAPAATPSAAALRSSKRVHVTTDLLDVEIDTFGGDIRFLGLRKHPQAIDRPDEPFVLMTDQGPYPYVAQSGLVGRTGGLPYHRTEYRAARTEYRLANGEGALTVDLGWRSPEGIEYTKRFHFTRDSYNVRVEFLVHNRGRTEWQGYPYGQLLRQAPKQGSGLFMLPTFTGAAIYTPEDRYQKISFDDMDDKAIRREVKGGWAAMMQHYFLGAWMPADAAQAAQLYTNALGSGLYLVGYKHTTPLVVPPGGRGSVAIDLFAGPKEHTRLENQPEGLKLTADYGWLTFIASPLFWLLATIHKAVGNWGWSIIVLTILIKAAFFPLNNAQYKSMAKMKKVGPRLRALKERYGADRERYSKEMMELYKKEKINPMAGCFPILVQIPVFIALYWVLLEAVEMRHAPFVLWIRDLSAQDPYYVLPVLMGASMFVTTWMSPATDPMQRRIFLAMPVVFTAFFLFFPGGLVLYWLVNNLLQIAQQWYINRSIEKAGG